MKRISGKILSFLLAVTLLFTLCPMTALAAEEIPFGDVPENYMEAVSWAYHQGLIKGTSDATFEPWLTLDRAQMATVLHRLAGEPKAEGPIPFPDISDGEWYTEAVRWANATGNMIGYDTGLFGTKDPIRRQDLAQLLYRYAVSQGYIIQTESLDGYPDGGAVSPYAKEGVTWAMASGILTPVDGRIRPTDNAIRGDIAAALLALAAPANSSVPRAAVAEYEARADARREAILDSKTEIVKSDVYIPGETYTGRAYYVSSSTGRDTNSGTSPNSPWQNIQRLDTANLRPGDAVFFKRGDMWRATLNAAPGVTYSAYGEGDKPVFTASPEDSASPGKWTLYRQGTDGRKIWKYYKELDMVGGIYLNGGALEAQRAYGYWTGDGYVDVDLVYSPEYDPNNSSGWSLRVGGPQRPETSLADLEFCCMPEPLEDSYPCGFPYDRPGPLYLRCDAGNPGTVYNSIEFCGADWPIVVSSGCVFDNLAVRYWSTFAFRGHPESDRDVVIQNCEVARGRTNINVYTQSEPTTDYMLINDAVYGVAQNAVIRDNYLHDIDGAAITFETYSGQEPQDTVPGMDGSAAGLTWTCTGNLIERCGAGVQINDGNDWFNFDRITVSGNIVTDTGYNYGTETMGSNCCCAFSPLVIGTWGKISAAVLEVSDNVFARSRRYILALGWDSVYDTPNEVRFHDNVYVQALNGIFGPSCYGDWFVHTAADPLLRPRLREYTHGENETVITVADQ